jgi:hypothetical protein
MLSVVMIPHIPVGVYHRFGSTYCLCLLTHTLKTEARTRQCRVVQSTGARFESQHGYLYEVNHGRFHLHVYSYLPFFITFPSSPHTV